MKIEPHQDTSKLKCKRLKTNKSSKRKAVTYKGAPIRLSADFSKETLQARRDWQEISKLMEKQGPTAKITLP